ncbi:MAG: hypothetical protein EA357_03000 [Micavibrio sp.]|nr:MAG: hypothetical protein EA357_03000 [Micavibrio sp.]
MRKIQLNFSLLCALALTAAVFFTATAGAEAARDPVPLQAVPENMQGLWVAPDCLRPREWHFYSAYFVFRAEDGSETVMQRAAKLQDRHDYTVIGFDPPHGASRPARVLEDGVMEMVKLESGAPPAQKWNDLAAVAFYEYMHCLDTELPSGFAEIMRRSARLDTVYPACRAQITPDCVQSVFSAYLPPDGETLGKTEIREILNDIAFFSALHGGGGLPESETGLLAGRILRVFDQDGSGSITPDEAESTRNILDHPALAGPQKYILKNLLDNLSPYFPSLK